MAIDLFGADVELFITSSGGKMVPFQSLVGPASDFIEEVRVSIGLSQLANIEITMSPPINDAFELLKKGLIGLGFNNKTAGNVVATTLSGNLPSVSDLSSSIRLIAVRLRYGGIQSPMFKGVLLAPEVSIGTEGISITMKATGMAFQTSKKNSEIKTPQGIPRIATLIKILGADVIIIPDAAAAIALQKPRLKAYFQSKNNWEAAKELVDEVDCEITAAGTEQNLPDGKQIYRVISRAGMRQKRQCPTFVAYRDINPNAGIYPLLSLTPVTTGVTLPGGAFGSKISIFNRTTKTFADHNADSKSYALSSGATASTGDGTVAGEAGGSQTIGGDYAGIRTIPSDTVGPRYPAPDRSIDPTGFLATSKEKVSGVVHHLIDKVFTYDLVSIGVVDLLPGQMVKVQVADVPALSDEYDLYSVEHVISSSGVETSMHVNRTGGFGTAISQGISTLTGAARPRQVCVDNLKIAETLTGL